MKKLTCADLGTPECPFVAEGETNEEVVAKMMEHAKETHADKLEGKSDEEIQAMMEGAIKEEVAEEDPVAEDIAPEMPAMEETPAAEETPVTEEAPEEKPVE